MSDKPIIGRITFQPGPSVSIAKTTDYQYWRTGDQGISRDLIKAMAMDAGKSLCAYLEVMFPEVWHSQNSGFKISMKHHVYNDIMALADLHDEAAIKKRLADNEAHRKAWVGGYRKMRRKKRSPPLKKKST